MACYHPLYATKSLRPDGKYNITIWNEWKRDEYEERTGKKFVERADFLPLPCGHCIGCRLEYSRQWANRLMMELESHSDAWFVTMTYDNDHVPISWYSDPDTGEASPAMSLRKRDVQLFFKRLRKEFEDCHIRYFIAGEYGGQTHRPHYHAIVFGLKLDELDLIPYKRSDQGFVYYNSSRLNKVWPFGYVVVAKVTWETCAYTSRYVTKKLTGDEAEFYKIFNIEPEFALMSRKPGIGKAYYDNHKGLMEFDYVNLKTDTQGLKFRPPRYFEKLYELDEPVMAKKRKDRLSRVAVEYQKLKKSEISFEDQLSVEEEKLLQRIKSLKRNKIKE